MKTSDMRPRGRLGALLLAGLLLSGAVSAAAPDITAKIEPAEIALGEAARLTISASGDDLPSIAPPVVPGLEFMPMSQSRRIESVNGVTTSSFSVTYQVIARQAGTYVISSIAHGAPALTLRVAAGGAPGAQPGGAGSAAAPSAATGAAANGATHLAYDGTAFVRLVLPKHELYVGESIPVEIQVGTRDGVVASLNGTPTLNGDAFTLDKLTSEPERRTEEVIDGKPFTVFTWHSVLAAVKPGALSLTMETPLTVRVQNGHPAAQFADDATLGDLFNDPAFQGFFGGSTEKDITVSSPSMNFTVLELPMAGRPANFSGAVGQFKISSELSDGKTTVGDPLTLRMRVSGEGNFDRVNSPMLSDVPQWKTYQPQPKFVSADNTTYRGEKSFEQPVVALEPGSLTLPALTFSYFDPAARRYETAHAEPLTVEVAPAASSAASVAADQPARPAVVPPPRTPAPGSAALRPDHSPQGRDSDSLVPIYYRPGYLALPSIMLLAFSGAWLWLRRRERRPGEELSSGGAARRVEPARLAGELNRATSMGNVQDFFHAAKMALQKALSVRWQVPPESVTLAEIDTRLGADSDVRRLFALADEAIYSGRRFAKSELEHWQRVVLRHMQHETAS